MSADDVTIAGYAHVALVVDDLDAARRFWIDLLGLAEIPRPVRPGKTRRMQQYTARTRQSHRSSPCTSISTLSAATAIRN